MPLFNTPVLPHSATHQAGGSDSMHVWPSGLVIPGGTGIVAISPYSSNVASQTVNGTYHLSPFTAPIAFTAGHLSFIPQAAGASIQTCKAGLYLFNGAAWAFVASTGDLGSLGTNVANGWSANVLVTYPLAFAGATHTTAGTSAALAAGSLYVFVLFAYGASTPTQPKFQSFAPG